MTRLLLTAFLLLFTQASLAQSADEEASAVELKATLEHLNSAVAASDLTFIRNDNRATRENASQHIRRTY